MGHRRQGKLFGGEHIPDYIRSFEIGVQPIAAVIREMQLAAGEGPRLL
jgi:hypothetical protein